LPLLPSPVGAKRKFLAAVACASQAARRFFALAQLLLYRHQNHFARWPVTATMSFDLDKVFATHLRAM